MTINPLSELPAELNDDVLESLPEGYTPLIRLVSPGGRFQMYHDSRWRMITNRHDVTILRMVDRGDLISQCNVTRLTDLPSDKQLSAKAFTEEVRQALGKNLGQIVESHELESGNGLRILRVVASGLIDEVSVQWIYYHVADPQGRRASIVFTFQSDRAERLADADRTLVTTCQFLDPPATAPK